MERKIGDKYTDKNGVERTLLSATDYNWNALTKSSKNYLGLTILQEAFPKAGGLTTELYPTGSKDLLYQGKVVKTINENETYEGLTSLSQEGRMPSKISKTGISTLKACFLTNLRDVKLENGTVGKRVAYAIPKDYVSFVKFKLPNLERLTANMFAERDDQGFAISEATIKQPIEVKKTMARVVALVEKYPNIYPLLPVQLQALSVVQDAFVEGKTEEKILKNVVRPDEKELSGFFPTPGEQGKGKGKIETYPGNVFFKKKLEKAASAGKMRRLKTNTLAELNIMPEKITVEILGDELTKARADVEQLSKQPLYEPKEKSNKDDYLESLANSVEKNEDVVEKQSNTENISEDYNEELDESDDMDYIYDDDMGYVDDPEPLDF